MKMRQALVNDPHIAYFQCSWGSILILLEKKLRWYWEDTPKSSGGRLGVLICKLRLWRR